MSVYTSVWDFTKQHTFWGILFLIFPSFLILGWGIFAFKNNKNNSEKMYVAGDQLYMIGYLGTIVSLVSSLIISCLFEADFGSNMGLYIRQIFVALTTTLVGLCIMFFFRVAAEDAPSFDPHSIQKTIDTKIKWETEVVKGSMCNFAEGVKNASEKMHDLSTKTDRWTTSITSTNEQLGKTAKKLDEIANSFIEVKSIDIKEETITKIKSAVEGIAKVSDAVLKISSVIKEIPLDGLDKFTLSITESNKSMVHLKSNMAQLNTILSDFAQLQEKNIIEEKYIKEKRLDEMKRLSSSIEKLTLVVDKLYTRVNIPVDIKEAKIVELHPAINQQANSRLIRGNISK